MDNSKGTALAVVEFVPMSLDDYSVRSPILAKPPIVLVPISLTRRRRTNAEEIGASFI